MQLTTFNQSDTYSTYIIDCSGGSAPGALRTKISLTIVYWRLQLTVFIYTKKVKRHPEDCGSLFSIW